MAANMPARGKVLLNPQWVNDCGICDWGAMEGLFICRLFTRKYKQQQISHAVDVLIAWKPSGNDRCTHRLTGPTDQTCEQERR